MADIVAELTKAASDAIIADARSLTYDQDRIRGVVIELEVRSRGQGVGANGRVYIERKTRRNGRAE